MMKKSFHLFFFFFLLVILSSTFHQALSLPPNGKATVEQTKSRVCSSKSHGFRGSCISDHNCGLVCRNEGFTGGDCGGFRRRCFCTKQC